MKKTLLTLLAVLGTGVLVIVSVFFGYIGWSNTANRYEQDIPAQYTQMQNVYDNGWKQVMEENQMSDKYATQFKDAFQAIMRGDSNGQQAMLQILTAMPNFDSSVTKKVMESIEVFHSQFSASQQQLISLKQSYGTFLFATTSGRVYNTFGNYPHIKCGLPIGSTDDYAILTSNKTASDFKNHQADALNLSK